MGELLPEAPQPLTHFRWESGSTESAEEPNLDRPPHLTRSLQKFINLQHPVASDAIGNAYFRGTSASPALGQVTALYVEEVPVPVFLLTPVSENLTDHAWALSWHVGPVKIAAISADAARRLAAGQYTMAAYPEGQFIAGRSPWLEPDLVTIALLVDGRTL